MSNRYKVTSYSTDHGIWGCVISFDGLLSHTTGPHDTRTEARTAAVAYVRDELGGILWPRIRIGSEIEGLARKVRRRR